MWRALTLTLASCLLRSQERIVQLEQDLDEERHSGDQLMDRIDRGRDQV